MHIRDLCGSWNMSCSDGRSFCAAVPGTVLGTLLENGAIPDPFDGANEACACEETRKIWRFERSFEVAEAELGLRHADLVFEGLDTLAEIQVNGKTAARTNNMHRTWRIPAGGILKLGKNRISVVFSPAMQAVEKAAEENPDITWEGGSELRWTGAIRKAHYMFGWDWGPRLPDAGIWRKCRLECYDSRIEDLQILQRHKPGEAELEILARTGAEQIRLILLDPDGNRVAEAETAGGRATLTIAQPRLWWPNGLGEQPLYTLKAAALSGGRTEDRQELRLGLRTMTVSREKDKWGESFALSCNGTPFFSMGADYIPEDNLLTRTSRKKTEKLLKDCRDCHFNTIRVWGGGIYPDDGFYDLCDELGLVVWQDLMFACNTYRMTAEFRENIIREAEDNLRRIRHHASLGLVCGNNEMETAWMDWEGVRNQPESLKKDYLDQFENVLKQVCGKEAPDLFYWPSSPSSGGGFDKPNDLDRGDVHDWSVWHGRRPFSDFSRRFPRFCSEFGFESFPCMETLKTFIHDGRDMNPFSRVMESHQKCRDGNGTMLYYLSQTLRYPFSMEKLVHASQWLQAEAVRTGVEHWRRNRGRCMGAIYWQLNDCWPTASWASIDSFGRWKALQYAARRFFAPVAVSLCPEENGYAVWVTNERREDFNGYAECILRDEKGFRIRKDRLEVSCPAMSSVRAGTVSGEEGSPPIVQAVLRDGGGTAVSENEALFTLPKYYPFEEPALSVRCSGKTVTVTADTFCTGVELQAGDTLFSDNWFSLYPGEPREVTADRELQESDLRILRIE